MVNRKGWWYVMAYYGYITTIKEIKKHPNADKLQITYCFGNQCVIGLDMYIGQKVVYFPEGGQLNYEFALENNLLRIKNEDGTYSGGYMDANKRRITTIRLRGEVSDGLILPIECLSKYTNIDKLKEGDKIDTLGGVLLCNKYIPATKIMSNVNRSEKKTKKNKKEALEQISYPYFLEHVDTNQLVYNINRFQEGDICTISLKMHGTSDRISNTLEVIKKKPSKIQKLFGAKPRVISRKWKVMQGTRRVILKDNIQDGYYGSNDFRNKYKEQIKENLPKGMTVYGEIVGWVNETTPIMGKCSNKKLGYDYVQKYGDETIFDYGCEPGESDFYVYRITMTNEDGYVIELPTLQAKIEAEKLGLKFVPIFETFTFTTIEDLMERINKYVDGPDLIGHHIREGVVIRIENKDTFVAFKHKNDTFKILSGIISENMNTENMTEDMVDEMA